MRKSILVLLGIVSMYSCKQAQSPEGEWIDKTTEKHQLSIKQQDGKLWMYFNNTSMELAEDGNDYFLQFREQKYPIQFDKDNELLEVFKKQYIPLHKSQKGQFKGQWLNANANTVFNIQLDGNTDLTWDIIKGNNKAVRFYPKKTDDGFHFSMGKDTLSFTLSGGMIVDANGIKYIKQTTPAY